MGEYAKRKSDGLEVKIGTCASMYYLRYEQRNEVNYDFGEEEFYWRIPTPKEDGILPGEYDYSLLDGQYIPYELKLSNIDDSLSQKLASHVGLTQVRNEKLGMLINMPCHHGLRLPEPFDGFKFFWNGKVDSLYLYCLVNKENELKICIKCNACGEVFSGSFTEMAPIIVSLWMKLRLLHQCTEYWYEHNDEPCYYMVMNKDREGKLMEIYNLSGEKDRWQVSVNDEIVKIGTWDLCRNEFISRLQIEQPNDKYDSDVWSNIYENKAMYNRYIGEL